MVRVAPFRQGDGDAFLAIYAESLAYYGLRMPPLEVKDEMLTEYQDARGMNVLIAWQGDRPVGYASWVRVFPAGTGFAVYLKELFVSEAARGSGAGRALMGALAGVANDIGATRLQWETSEPDAFGFYEALGAISTGKTHYAVPNADLHKLMAPHR